MEEQRKNRPIGVFDSGVGGLTVLKQLVKLRPDMDYIYFGDTKNLPYGEKSKSRLLEITREIFDFFEKKEVSSVVMACNTSSAQVYEELKDSYPFKLYPIIQTASKCIAQDKSLKKIVIFATNGTINSKMYSKSLKMHNQSLETLEIACPEWVPIVEKRIGSENKAELIEKYLKPALDFKPDKIILGCTHYPYLLDDFTQFAPKNLFINPAESFSEYIAKDFPKPSTKNQGMREFFVSSEPQNFVKNASVFYEINEPVKLADLG